MPAKRILLTGGTGFLGQYVLAKLDGKFEVDVISRSAEKSLRGDLTRWDGGIADVAALRGRKYAAFVHLAGLYDLTASSTDCYLHNVVGTGNALKLCRDLGIPVFLNTSSVAAAINSKLPVVRPYDLNFGSPFPDAYSESKAHAEQLLQNWSEGPRLRVNIRPGVLVGDSRSGRINRIDGPYHAPQAVDRLRHVLENFPAPLPLPGEEGRRLPLVPVDACADAIARLLEWSLASGEEGYRSYHLVPEQGLPVREFYKTVFRHLYIRHRGIRLIHQLPSFAVKKISKWLIRFPEEELSYLLSFPKYDTSGAVKILGNEWCPEFSSYERAFWSGYEEYLSNR